ncbi:MAG: N-acetyl-gamma-glutamyl-phosphate reductase [Gemmatimonadales bacterium]|nr:MAG: N-acetyl-gamma-glutamyl-phosphate reductase [Gemmatimonadales bacterium]
MTRSWSSSGIRGTRGRSGNAWRRYRAPAAEASVCTIYMGYAVNMHGGGGRDCPLVYIHAMTDDAESKGPLARVGVLGGSGYTGLEATTLLAKHPGVSLAFTSSRSAQGSPSPAPGLPFTVPDEARAREVDVLFLCLPHGTAAEWVDRILGAGGASPRIVDLTADHRPGSGRENGAVYGLNEWFREEIAQAKLVANPGCYPTGVLASLLPLVRAGLPARDHLTVINAASGVTGAGRTSRTDLLFGEVSENFRAYGTGNRHRHLREMRALLQDGVDLVFQPHLLPVRRGILETMVVPVTPGVGPDDVRAAWREKYEGEPAIRILDEGLPALSDVRETDRCHLGVEELSDTGRPAVMVGAALDNLGKGAAGQALQNLNAMMNWPTERGLRC